MKFRFPLSAKILLWFFLNLLLLGAVFYGFCRIQFRVGLDSLLAGQAGERVEAISRVLRDELREQPRSEWTTILKRFSTGYGVRFLVYRFDGMLVAGEPTPLPPAVMQRLREFRSRSPIWSAIHSVTPVMSHSVPPPAARLSLSPSPIPVGLGWDWRL